MIYDLIVIGAGPAGCAAAITAAREGASVLLIERGCFPRHKVCGEFVSAESLDLLQNLLAAGDQNLIRDALRISQARIFLDGAIIAAEITPAAGSITRFDLDRALWNGCLQAGVDARATCAAQSVEGTGPFRVMAADEVFESKSIVNAAGRWSVFTGEAIRARATQERWIGLKAHFSESVPSSSVDLYFFDGGYCGVQPVSSPGCPDHIVNACAMVKANTATDLQGVLRCHPALQHRSQDWQAETRPVTTAPLVFHEPDPIQGQMLQVGDAATFVDPFIGDGISLALRSGTLAANCLEAFFHNQSSLAQAANTYVREYQRRLAPVFRASSRVRNLLRFPAFVRKPAISVLQRTPALTRRLVQMTR